MIEYQKRGLPHAHILVILSQASKPKTSADVDAIVQAELPTREDQKEVGQLAESFMVHGPCGALNPNCPRMKDGVCSKGYRKEFQNETLWKDNGYPMYCRRAYVNGEKVATKDGILDNRSVVPHNLKLIKNNQCHINVEACTSIKEVKYL